MLKNYPLFLINLRILKEKLWESNKTLLENKNNLKEILIKKTKKEKKLKETTTNSQERTKTIKSNCKMFSDNLKRKKKRKRILQESLNKKQKSLKMKMMLWPIRLDMTIRWSEKMLIWSRNSKLTTTMLTELSVNLKDRVIWTIEKWISWRTKLKRKEETLQLLTTILIEKLKL